ASRYLRIGDGASLGAGELVLSPERFQQGGFAQYNLTAEQALTLTSGTVIHPRTDSIVADPGAAPFQPSGPDLSAFSSVQTLPDPTRKPAGLTLATTLSGSQISLEAGSAIVGDPGAAIQLKPRDGLDIAGSIVAPGGTITITQTADSRPLHIESG